jgi:MoxR-like ATPase
MMKMAVDTAVVAPLTAKVGAVAGAILARHIGREDVVHATLLSLVSGRPAFFLGPPGVDKTGCVQELAARIQGSVFFDALMPTVVSPEQLLVESTSIEESVLEDGGKQICVRETLGRAAKAHVIFADEIWKAEPRVLQTMLDLARGGGVRHEGELVATPLLSFVSASNELPDQEGNLSAIWSRMTIRVEVRPLDRGGKTALVAARLRRDRHESSGESATLTLDDIDALRASRPEVEVPEEIVTTVLDILQELVDDGSSDFDWAWADDRRFGRLFDLLQAEALLTGRSAVSKADLWVLEWLLWDTPEQAAIVRAKVAPYCRTPLMDAQEQIDALLAPGGTVATVLSGDRGKGVQALTQCEEALKEIARLKSESDTVMAAEIEKLEVQLNSVKTDVVAVTLGTKKGGS